MDSRPSSQRRALLPPDYPGRFALADEVHARPPEVLTTPSRATYVAVLITPEHRRGERAHLAALCQSFSVAPPAADAAHFSADLGPARLKWERHGEFSGYMFSAGGRSPAPFSEPAAAMLPPGWLADVPGETVFAAHAKLISAAEEEPNADFLTAFFNGNVVVGATIGGGAGLAFTDFRIHADGFARFLMLDRSLTPRQAGRMMQRLFEIETYRMMALLALPVAREQSRQCVVIEASLTSLAEEISRHGAGDEAILQQLTRLAADVERGLAASQFRFGACRAYHDLVITRIAELREVRLPGVQTIEEFMVRRFTPAAATCASTSQRLHALSERVAQASALLSTRVNIVREKQNQMLLQSMDRRAKLQLRLQQAVESLSIAAIVYYVAGLVGYISKGLKLIGLGIEPDIAVGIAIPIVAIASLYAVRRAHRKIFAGSDSDASADAFDMYHSDI